MQPKNNDMNSIASGGHGFSLIELLAVLAILAILATIQYPTYLESVRKTKRAEGRAALTQLMQQQERYYSQHGSYIAFSSSVPNGYKWFSGNTPESSSYEISGAACKDDTLQNCVVLVATPGTDKVNAAFRDPICGDLSLASNGIMTASGHGTQCW
jgi:type IV pilus assembly protein PilE